MRPLRAASSGQLAGVRRVLRDRLFHQQMFSPHEQLLRNLVMCVRWRGHGNRVNHSAEFIKRLCRRGAVFGGNVSRARKIDIVDGGELRRRKSGIKARVIAANVTDANDSNAQSFHREKLILAARSSLKTNRVRFEYIPPPHRQVEPM